MPRNFERRVEVVVPVEDPNHGARLRRLLETSCADTRQAWDLHSDGTYTQRTVPDGREISSQTVFMADPWGLAPDREEAVQRSADAERVPQT
jgi:polyphosphate kinase